MTRSVDPAFLDRPCRTGGAWELVLADRAAPAEQSLLAGLGDDPTLYGLLRPVGEPPGRSLRAVDRDTALLLLTLTTSPGPIPAYARRPDPALAAEALAALVLDGLLEIADPEGRWLSGGAALPLFAVRDTGPASAGGELARLSHDALCHAAAFPAADPLEVAARLYQFGRVPIAPRLERELGSDLADGPAVLGWLGLGPGGARRRLLERDWRVPADTREGWLAFERRSGASRSEGPSWKLYFSPRVAALPDALEAFAAALARHGAHAFKLGADAAGLTRPDKAVAYFASFEALGAAGQDLAERLAGVPAQGVPFTAPIDRAGLLSWGVDPPDAEALPWWGRQSWRMWVTQRLGSALVAARGSAADPVATALARLALEGVDVERWTPSLSLWANLTPDSTTAERSPR